jgi:hypothetical protein
MGVLAILRDSQAAPTDTELMVAVRDGDLVQLGVLFERHHLHLFNFFLRLTGSRQLSGDLVQEAFIRILKYRKSFRLPGRPAIEVGRLSGPKAVRHAPRRWTY